MLFLIASCWSRTFKCALQLHAVIFQHDLNTSTKLKVKRRVTNLQLNKGFQTFYRVCRKKHWGITILLSKHGGLVELHINARNKKRNKAQQQEITSSVHTSAQRLLCNETQQPDEPAPLKWSKQTRFVGKIRPVSANTRPFHHRSWEGVCWKAWPGHTKQLPIVQPWSALRSPEFLGSHFTGNVQWLSAEGSAVVQHIFVCM